MSLVDGRSLPQGEELEADLCIIGGGPAGLSLAYALAGQGLSVTLVETGGIEEESGSSALNGGGTSSSKYAPLTMYRRRMLGGASAIWGGRCVPFDPIDFEARDYAPHSGWPIGYDDLKDYYARATRLCDAGEPEYDADIAVPDAAPLIAGFESDVINARSFERFSLPTNFWTGLGPELLRAKNLRIVTNATCHHLQSKQDGRSLDQARFATLEGRGFSVRAKRFVVAAGGIETYRLLAASNDVVSGGVGNGHGVLGRYFMSHIEGAFARLRLADPRTPIHWGFDMAAGGIYGRRRLRVTEDAQRSHKLLNTILRLHYPSAVNPEHRNAVLSTMFFAKNFILAEYRRKITMVERAGVAAMPKGAAFWTGHLRNVVLGAPELVGFLGNWIAKRNLATRKIPYVTLGSRAGVYPLDLNAEQLPNPDSRLLLGSDVDPLGVPFASVDWSMTDIDVASIAGTLRLLREEVAKSGVGDVEFDDLTLEEDIRREAVPIGGHHLGAARMSVDPKQGVVDGNLKVHDCENLYIASGAVFPTSSHANPTLTIVALSLRLGDHLKSLHGAG